MITFNDLQKANEKIITTNIKGKGYAEVNQRIKAFKMVYPEGFITTEMLSNEIINGNGICVFKAACGFYGENGCTVLGTGTAYEKESSSFINKTSYIENCETSAVGRALGMAGFGIDTSVASYEEVQNAINNQNAKNDDYHKPIAKDYLEHLLKTAKEKGVTPEKLCKKFSLGDIAEVNYEQYYKAIDGLYKMPDINDEH